MKAMNNPSDTTDRYFEELYTPLFRYFYFRTRDRYAAEDLTQTTFVKFLQQNKKLDTKDYLTKLLFTIARTTLIDQYRVASKRKHQSIEHIDIDIVSPELDPEQLVSQSQDVAAVQEAIATLSQLEQDIVLLRMTTDMDYQVIAEIHAISPANARQIHARALKKITPLLRYE